MRKTISKLISLFSLGLLLFAVPNAYATGEDTVKSIKASTALEFLKKYAETSINDDKDLKDKQCFTAFEGQGTGQQVTKYCIEKTKGQIEVRPETGTGDLGCEVIEVSWFNARNCAFCPFIGVLYQASETVTKTAKEHLATSFAIVIGVGLMVWIAFKTFIFVSELSKQDAAKYVTELLVQSFKFLMAFFILLTYNDIFDFVVNPLIKSGMSYGTKFVENISIEDRFPGIYDSKRKLNKNKMPEDYKNNYENRFYTVESYMTMEHLAFSVNMQYSLLQAVGKSLVCTGLNLFSGKYENESEGFGLGFACIVYGACFVGFGFILTISFIFYLFDAVVQLGIVGALLPALVAAWPFKITSKYASKGFEMLLSTVFIFMMMGVVTHLNIKLINSALENNITIDPKKLSNGVAGSDGLAAMVNALSLVDTRALNGLVNIISIGFIMFLVANIIAMMMLQRVKNFADTFASGCIPGIGNKMGGRAASMAKGAATKMATPGVVSEGIKEGFSKGTSGARRAVKNKFKNLRNKAVGKIFGTTDFGKKYLAARYERKLNEDKPSESTKAENQENINKIFE